MADGIIIAFDLTSVRSFANISSWFESIQKIKNDNVPKVLVGNKSDLTEERAVCREDAEKVA